MALRKIRTDGDPLLRKKSREIKEIDSKILELINDMKDTMNDAGGIGIAAPQVGTLRRVVIVDINEEQFAMINPVIVEKEGSCVDIEGCLSIPNFRASVERPETISVKYLNEDGDEISLDLEGYNARIVCHELDHLDGVLFNDIYIDEYVLNEDGEYEVYE